MAKTIKKVLFLATVKEILDYFKNSTGLEGLPDLDKAIELLKPLNVKFSSYTYLEAIELWENFKHYEGITA